tara:strand:- start:10035 stop:10283 length:249 start_codon:yes stop_codon:yes gene_type:complete
MELQPIEKIDKEQIQKIKDKLEEVVDDTDIRIPNRPIISDPNKFPIWQEPHHPTTPNPYRVDCSDNLDKKTIDDLQSGVKKK